MGSWESVQTLEPTFGLLTARTPWKLSRNGRACTFSLNSLNLAQLNRESALHMPDHYAAAMEAEEGAIESFKGFKPFGDR